MYTRIYGVGRAADSGDESSEDGSEAGEGVREVMMMNGFMRLACWTGRGGGCGARLLGRRGS